MKLDALKSLMKQRPRGPMDVVGVDFGASGTKAVRVRRTGEEYQLVAAAILPPEPMPDASGAASPRPIPLPKLLRARQVALAVSSQESLMKLLIAPGPSDRVGDLDFYELLGVDAEKEYRLGYEILRSAEGRSETPVLAVALPERLARWACQRFPAGLPAPCSLEVSGLAALTCFMHGLNRIGAEAGVLSVELGAEISLITAFAHGHPTLVRQINVGWNDVLAQVQKSLGVEPRTAQEILESGSVDTSRPVRAAMESFLHQLVVARDFVERRYNCGMQRLFVCGGASRVKGWQELLRGAVGLAPEVWDPLALIPALPGAIPETVHGSELRFAAAMGAALGALEEGAA